MEPCKAFIEFVLNNLPEYGHVCEIGCYDGITTKEYANHIKHKNGHLHVVDWFEGCIGEPDYQYHGHRPSEAGIVYNKFLDNIKSVECSDILTVHHGMSLERAGDFEDESLDICFIDACHMYESVKKDIAAYLPKVKSGGYLMGHDFETWDLLGKATPEDLQRQCSEGGHFGVVYAVADFFKKDEIQLLKDNVWLFKK